MQSKNTRFFVSRPNYTISNIFYFIACNPSVTSKIYKNCDKLRSQLRSYIFRLGRKRTRAHFGQLLLVALDDPNSWRNFSFEVRYQNGFWFVQFFRNFVLLFHTMVCSQRSFLSSFYTRIARIAVCKYNNMNNIKSF